MVLVLTRARSRARKSLADDGPHAESGLAALSEHL